MPNIRAMLGALVSAVLAPGLLVASATPAEAAVANKILLFTDSVGGQAQGDVQRYARNRGLSVTHVATSAAAPCDLEARLPDLLAKHQPRHVIFANVGTATTPCMGGTPKKRPTLTREEISDKYVADIRRMARYHILPRGATTHITGIVAMAPGTWHGVNVERLNRSLRHYASTVAGVGWTTDAINQLTPGGHPISGGTYRWYDQWGDRLRYVDGVHLQINPTGKPYPNAGTILYARGMLDPAYRDYLALR